MYYVTMALVRIMFISHRLSEQPDTNSNEDSVLWRSNAACNNQTYLRLQVSCPIVLTDFNQTGISIQISIHVPKIYRQIFIHVPKISRQIFIHVSKISRQIFTHVPKISRQIFIHVPKISRQIFIHVPKIKFHGNKSSSSLAYVLRADGMT
jgi:hypothetical protein